MVSPMAKGSSSPGASLPIAPAMAWPNVSLLCRKAAFSTFRPVTLSRSLIRLSPSVVRRPAVGKLRNTVRKPCSVMLGAAAILMISGTPRCSQTWATAMVWAESKAPTSTWAPSAISFSARVRAVSMLVSVSATVSSIGRPSCASTPVLTSAPRLQLCPSRARAPDSGSSRPTFKGAAADRRRAGAKTAAVAPATIWRRLIFGPISRFPCADCDLYSLRGGRPDDNLRDGAEQRLALGVLHLDMDPVARRQERGLRLALADGFHRADLGQAGIAQAALRDRLARSAVGVAVRHGARADDGAGRQRTGPGGMGDQGREVEGHVDARIGLAEQFAVQMGQQRQMQLAAVPGVAERVRRHRHRREGRGGLGLEEAETFGQLVGDQAAQGDVIDQHHQQDGVAGFVDGTALAHGAGDHRDFGFEIAAPGRVVDADRIMRGEEAVRAALIHQRIGPERGRHLGAE